MVNTSNMEIFSHGLWVICVLCTLIFISYKLAQTKKGKALGTALIVILLTAVVANLGIIPTASNSIPLYTYIFTYIAPLAIFYLTLTVNLTKLKEAGLPMLLLFLLGSLATVVGVLGAFYIFNPTKILNEYAAPIAGMITGTYSGGSINFNAVSLHYKVNEAGTLYAGTVAVDNVVTTLWILVTLALPRLMNKLLKNKKRIGDSKKEPSTEDKESLNFNDFSILLFSGLLTLWVSDFISALYPAIPSILILTTIALVLAQFPLFRKMEGAQMLGLWSVYLFLAVVGAYCELSAVGELGATGLMLLGFIGSSVIIHGLVIILIGRLISKDWDMIAIASQANIGGGTTAMALAETFDRHDLILPAILLGTLGNALGTYLGFMVTGILF